LLGVLLSALFFASKIERAMTIDSTLDVKVNTRYYRVYGQVFFSSSERLIAAFDTKETLTSVTIDVSAAHLWDVTAVAAIDKIVLRFRREGVQVELVGLNAASATMVEKFGIHDKPDAIQPSLH